MADVTVRVLQVRRYLARRHAPRDEAQAPAVDRAADRSQDVVEVSSIYARGGLELDEVRVAIDALLDNAQMTTSGRDLSAIADDLGLVGPRLVELDGLHVDHAGVPSLMNAIARHMAHYVPATHQSIVDFVKGAYRVDVIAELDERRLLVADKILPPTWEGLRVIVEGGARRTRHRLRAGREDCTCEHRADGGMRVRVGCPMHSAWGQAPEDLPPAIGWRATRDE